MTAVVLAVLIEDEQVLLGHRHPRREWLPDCWDLPGGHVEDGETPWQALVRECREELGIEVTAAHPVEVQSSSLSSLVMHAFVVLEWVGSPRNADPAEHDDIGWFSVSDLPGLHFAVPDCQPWLTTLMTQAHLALRKDHTASGLDQSPPRDGARRAGASCGGDSSIPADSSHRHQEERHPVYDRIGAGYAEVRRPDRRLATLVRDALGQADTVINVGAGAGSYEPTGPGGPLVVAIEPSSVMLAQHPGRHRVRAVASALPSAAGSFDAAMAVMTTHHWPDLHAGLSEMRRVATRQVVFTWDPGWERVLWVVEEYLPEIGRLERSRFPPLSEVIDALDAHTVIPFPIPWDFTDGYQPAFWRRPAAYLDPVVRAASSTFASLPESIVVSAMRRLRRDLASGAWEERHRDLLRAESVDYGYRLIVAG